MEHPRQTLWTGTLVVLCVSLLFSSVLAPGAGAQSGAESTSATPSAEEARAHFEAGRRHATAERWADALLEFQASEALAPRAVTEFNLATTLLRLGRAREALAMVDRLESRTEIDERIASDVVRLRAAARDAIRTLALAVSPPAARVEVDGEVVEGTGSPRAIPLDPGPHTLVVTAPGHAEQRLTLAPTDVARSVELIAAPAHLTVDAHTPDALITLDGEPAGQGRVEREVTVGEHRLRVTREGFTPFESTITVAAGDRLVIDASPSVPLTATRTSTPLHEEPLLWVGVGVGALVIAGVVIGIVVATTPPEPNGGSTGIVFFPLARF